MIFEHYCNHLFVEYTSFSMFEMFEKSTYFIEYEVRMSETNNIDIER
jgi:hypothetical protein